MAWEHLATHPGREWGWEPGAEEGCEACSKGT